MCSATPASRAPSSERTSACSTFCPPLPGQRYWLDTPNSQMLSPRRFIPAPQVWSRFAVGSDECKGDGCPFRDECFSERAKVVAQGADIIVANYHLLFAHLAVRRETGQDLVLPTHDLLILDEAHEAADIAREFFGFTVSEQAANQLHAVVSTAQEPLRGELRGITLAQLIRRSRKFRRVLPSDAVSATRSVLLGLATSWQQLDLEIDALDKQLERLAKLTAPDLLALRGVGVDVACALLVAARDNPERLSRESSFAALCGVSPIDASSGRQRRHRLNRGGYSGRTWARIPGGPGQGFRAIWARIPGDLGSTA